ncbi:MAG: OmpA family protein [Thermodesulfobacteriota bacterium]|nr:OmpA family protein [Thermodesulfobacteriota bacterium]
MRSVILFLTVFALLISTNLLAQRTNDIEGSKDYPLISRFEGSVIEYYKEVKWDDYQVPLSMMVTTEERGRFFEKNETVEGKVIRIQYSTSPDNNPAYVYKNYESAFRKAGFNTLFQGKGDDELGDEPADFCRTFYGDLVQKFGFAYNPQGENHAMIVAKTKKDNNYIYVIVYISGFSNVTLVTQDVIEVEAAETGHVTAQSIDEGIALAGYMSLDGIYFDTGKATLKSESTEALNTISEYLKAHGDKKYFIVGHTDNTGDFETNIKLSTERANAVMNELITKYGNASEQLRAHGSGSTSPVANNSTDEGKAKNRRVEIVEQ